MKLPAHPALAGLTVLERGWMSSNNILLQGEPGAGATLIDSGHCMHAAQTLALVRHALDGEPLQRLVNTHLHSDHCGGNATLKRAFGMPIHIPPGQWRAVRDWDEDALSYRATGQGCDRFTADAKIAPGDTLRSGGREWQVLAAPGHDPDAVILFDATHGVLISADALWENGFGVVFPELEGVHAFDDVAAVLDLIERLPVQWVLPGHGAPFQDVAGALVRARSRLAAFSTDPSRHARHAAKVLLKYHLMEQQQQALAEVRQWVVATPLLHAAWQQIGRPQGSASEWCDALLAELAAGGVLSLRDGVVYNA